MTQAPAFDVAALRKEFPLLERAAAAGTPLTYLDSASTAPKSHRVLEAIRCYYEQYTANIHRGVHALAVEASTAYEAARHAAATHIGAAAPDVVFTRGTTEGLNLVAASLGLRPEDEVILTVVDHHSNQIPWRMHAKCVYLRSREDGVPLWEELEQAIGPRTRLVAVHHASNVLGTIAPIAELARVTQARGVPLLVDGAQAAGHIPVDVRALNCDFYAYSGHKLGGPTGVGVLYARPPWLERLSPYQWGGGMVARVTDGGIEVREGPHRFEAGTPNVEGALGLAAAISLLAEIGMENVAAHGAVLSRLLVEGVATVPGVRLLGARFPSVPRIPLVALEVSMLDAETTARTLSDSFGIMLSAGRHCTHVLHDFVKAHSSLRASAWIINTTADIERFIEGLHSVLG